jgi:sugar lactone lactonase YvrE
VDSTLQGISWPYNEPGVNTDGILPAPIQFDSNGRIYYLGSNQNGNTVLRRVASGTPTDLINQNIEVSSFYVAPNGDVIHCGRTSSSNANWIRKLSSTGQLSTLKSKGSCKFLQKFSDGNLWIGSWDGTNGVLRYSLTQNKLLTSPFGYSGSSWGLGTPDIDLQAYSNEFRIDDSNQGFYGYSGAMLVDSFNFPSTKQSWVLAGWPGTTDLVRYTPSLMIAETSLSSYAMGRRVLNTLILTGIDKNEVNRLILYDTQSGNETVVFDGSNEIEIYDMVFVAGTNKLMFSGLRFSDNQFVVGEVAL